MSKIDTRSQELRDSANNESLGKSNQSKNHLQLSEKFESSISAAPNLHTGTREQEIISFGLENINSAQIMARQDIHE